MKKRKGGIWSYNYTLIKPNAIKRIHGKAHIFWRTEMTKRFAAIMIILLVGLGVYVNGEEEEQSISLSLQGV